MIKLKDILLEKYLGKRGYAMPKDVMKLFIKHILFGNRPMDLKFMNLFSKKCKDYKPSGVEVFYRSASSVFLHQNTYTHSGISSWTESFEFAKEWTDDGGGDVVIAYKPKLGEVFLKVGDVYLDNINKSFFEDDDFYGDFLKNVYREQEVILKNFKKCSS